MAESLYRRNPKEGDPFGILQSRRKLLNQSFVNTSGGKSASVRNPCWVTVTGRDKSCGGGGEKTLPIPQETWDKVYKPKIKPLPDLESVTIEYGGDWGLARKISAEIRCYTISDFLWVQRYFLLPGNEIDVSFGYKENWGVNQPTTTLKNFKVATFGFNTTQDGNWICTFTGVSSSTAIKNLDMQIVVCNGCNVIGGDGQSGNSGPLKYYTGKEQTRQPVKGVAQLIASDAQQNGVYSLDDMQDGEVITSFTDYNPGSKNKDAAIVVYTGDHLRNALGRAWAWVGGITKGTFLGNNEVESANNQIFVSLGYIVNRLINDQLLRAMGCGIAHERQEFSILKLEFDPVYSKCKVTDGITSGDPINMLMLGDANYKNNNGAGKDFDGDCKSLGAVKCLSGSDVKLQNILLHRDVVTAAFNEAMKKEVANADQTDVRDTGEQVINIIDFFGKIADQVASCTGGAIALRLVEDPLDNNILMVVDQNFGVTDTLNCIVLDPIDGDGSTRSCEIQSNVGSQEYKAAMFVGSSKKGDAISALRNCGDKLDNQKEKEYTKALADKFALIKSPGNLGENHFNGDEINALKSVMGRLNKNNPDTVQNETVHYPGLSISVELDGVWGIVPGNAITSTQVPELWRDTYKSYFMVSSVKNHFQGSDWQTSISGILAYYRNINYIQL